MPTSTYQLLADLGLPEGSVAIALGGGPQGFLDSQRCRDAMLRTSADVAVAVINRATHAAITPINLAAALSQDCPRRDVYLLEDEPSGSLVSRVRAAGIRGVIDAVQLRQLLGPSRPPVRSAAAGRPSVEGGQPAGDAPGQLDALESCGLDEPVDFLPPSMSVEPLPPLPSLLEAPAAAATSAPALQPPSPAAPPASHADASLAARFDPQTGQPLAEETPAPTAPTALPPVPPAPAPAPQPVGNVIGVFSGRGGVGKSTVALMLALAAHKRGLRVAIVDADLQFGDIAYLLGASRPRQVEVRPLLQAQRELPGLAAASPLLVLTAPDSVEQSELLAEAMPELIRQAAMAYQLVVVNTSAFWTASQARLAQACSRLLLMMDQRATSIKACQRVVDLCVKLQIPMARFAYALNGCHRFAPLSVQDASLALGGQTVLGLDDGGTLVDELLSLGCPWELLESGNAFVRSLDGLLDQLLPPSLGAAQQKASLDATQPESTALGFLKGLFKKGERDVA